jgi:hypothetical protein
MSEQFLTQDEKLKLTAISKSDSPESGLAQALLALNEGSSYGAAGNPVGLTSRQTRYRRDKFLKLRMGMFSQEITSNGTPEAVSPGTIEVEQEDLPVEEQAAAGAGAALTEQELPIESEIESQKSKGKKKSKGSKKSKQKKKKKKGKPKSKGKKGKKGKKEKKKRG